MAFSCQIIGYQILSYIETLIPTVSHFFSYFLLVSKLHELNVFKLCNIFQTLTSSIIHICGKFKSNSSSILAFFLVCKLYKSSLKVTHLIWDSFRFLDRVDIGGLVVAYFEKWNSTSSHFFSCLFIDTYKKCKSNHYKSTCCSKFS